MSKQWKEVMYYFIQYVEKHYLLRMLQVVAFGNQYVSLFFSKKIDTLRENSRIVLQISCKVKSWLYSKVFSFVTGYLQKGKERNTKALDF